MSHSQPGEQKPKLSEKDALETERHELLQRIEDWLETPMLVLAFVWLGLLIGGVDLGREPRL